MISAPPRRRAPAAGRRRSSSAAVASPFVLELGPQRIHLPLQVVDQAQRNRVERALVVGNRLDIPAHELAQDALDRRPEPTPDTRPQTQRAIGRDRPEPFGLVAERPPVGRPEPPPGSAPDRRTSSRSRSSSAATSTGLDAPRRSAKSLQNPGFPRCPQAPGHSSPGPPGPRIALVRVGPQPAHARARCLRWQRDLRA